MRGPLVRLELRGAWTYFGSPSRWVACDSTIRASLIFVAPARGPGWWAGALLGFAAGTGACFFAATVLSECERLERGELAFVIIGPLTIAATTVAGYAFAASKGATGVAGTLVPSTAPPPAQNS
jgi:hypothetical protein